MNKAFTLVEVLVTLGILTFITALGLFVSFDFYRSYASRSERNIIVTVLQKARSQSINNINQTRHGVHFQSSPLKYIIFECPTNTPQCNSYTPASTDLTVEASYKVSITHPTLPFDIVFDQLSGDCVNSVSFNCSTGSPITVTEGAITRNININAEGRIDW